jgi:probable F420-dependent oxidoreductase
VTAVHLPQQRSALCSLATAAGMAETAGFDGVWVGEVNQLDAVVPAVLAATGTTSATVGTVLNVFTRAPTTMALTAAALGDLAPGRVEIVLGASSPLLVERWNGIQYRRPLARLADQLRFLRAALAGERVRDGFETFSSEGFALAEPPAAPPAVLVAAAGPRAMALAAAEGDGVAVNWVAPGELDRLEELPPDRGRVALVTAVCPSPDRAVVDAVMRPVLASYLAAPAYAGLQRRLGRGPALAALWARWAAGDRAGALAALPGSVVDDLVVWGTPDECGRALAAAERASGARVVVSLFPPDGSDFGDVIDRMGGEVRAGVPRPPTPRPA